jgi:hypothetical protein
LVLALKDLKPFLGGLAIAAAWRWRRLWRLRWRASQDEEERKDQ